MAVQQLVVFFVYSWEEVSPWYFYSAIFFSSRDLCKLCQTVASGAEGDGQEDTQQMVGTNGKAPH